MDEEQGNQQPTSFYLRTGLIVVLFVALICLAGGFTGWLISGGLFFFVAIPLFFAYLVTKAAEAQRADTSEEQVVDGNAEMSATQRAEMEQQSREDLKSKAAFKLVMGGIVFAISFALIVMNFNDKTYGPEMWVVFGELFLVISLWPIVSGFMDLAKARK